MKPLIEVPMKPYITVSYIGGTLGLILDRYGECRCCSTKVFFGRDKPQAQWIPIERTNDDPPHYEIHRCEKEILRNAHLREVLFGAQPDTEV